MICLDVCAGSSDACYVAAAAAAASSSSPRVRAYHWLNSWLMRSVQRDEHHTAGAAAPLAIGGGATELLSVVASAVSPCGVGWGGVWGCGVGAAAEEALYTHTLVSGLAGEVGHG